MQEKQAWQAFKKQRYDKPTLYDEMWGEEVLTQPAAIKIAEAEGLAGHASAITVRLASLG